MKNLIKKHASDVEKYRIDSEKEYQKILKINERNKKNIKNENIFPEEDCVEDIDFKKVNYNGTAGEYLDLNFESLDNKMNKFIKKNKEEHKVNGGVKNNDIKNMEKKEENGKFDESIEIEITKKDGLNSSERENMDKNNIKNESDIKNNSPNLKLTKGNDSNKSLNGNEFFPMNDLLANISTEGNSKRTNTNEESNKSNAVSAAKENKKNIQSPKDICDIFENNDNDSNIKKSFIVRKPSIFENHPNDISYINNKEKDENIDDSDDDGTTNEAKEHNNYFKSLDIYLNNTKSIYCENKINK